MDNFKIIYKILKTLERALDYDEFDSSTLSAERLGISRNRWEQIWIMLAKEGYVDGVCFTKGLTDKCYHIAEPIQPVITLKGLEYLADNSLMTKAAKLAKGITDMIP